MEENFQQKIEARLAELPTQVQEAIASSDFEERIRTICRAQNLHVDQMQAVADETTLAMLGFIDMDDLAAGLQEQAHIPAGQAQTVAAAITHEVFMPIRESMKAWAAGRKGSEVPTSAPAASAPSMASTVASGPSVVMPSSSTPVVPSTLAPITVPIAAPGTPAPLSTATPVAKTASTPVPNLMAADAILNEKKVTPPTAAPTPAAPATLATPAASPMPKVDPAQPQNYKADPYREPVDN